MSGRDSGSSMIVLTRAELSRYQVSALIGPESFQHLAGPQCARGQRQRWTEFRQMSVAAPCTPGRQERIEPFGTRNGNQ